MTELLSAILLIMLISRLTESQLKVPFTLALILISYLLSHLMPELFRGLANNFDEILFMMLPVILLPDILQMSFRPEVS
jgi:CPA1 family monovalent cation:H+ antiporter